MSKLHSQLALFGAIDQEVVAAKARLREAPEGTDPEIDNAVIGLVEGFLPGTTRFGQHGWYEQLTNYLETRAVRPPAQGSEVFKFPDLGDAIDELETNISEEDDERDPVLARAAYGAARVSHCLAMMK